MASSLVKPYNSLTKTVKDTINTSQLSKDNDGYYQLLDTQRWTSQNFYLQMTNKKEGNCLWKHSFVIQAKGFNR